MLKKAFRALSKRFDKNDSLSPLYQQNIINNCDISEGLGQGGATIPTLAVALRKGREKLASWFVDDSEILKKQQERFHIQ